MTKDLNQQENMKSEEQNKQNERSKFLVEKNNILDINQGKQSNIDNSHHFNNQITYQNKQETNYKVNKKNNINKEQNKMPTGSKCVKPNNGNIEQSVGSRYVKPNNGYKEQSIGSRYAKPNKGYREKSTELNYVKHNNEYIEQSTGSRYTKPNKGYREKSTELNYVKHNNEYIEQSTGSRYTKPNNGNLEQSTGTRYHQPNNGNIEQPTVSRHAKPNNENIEQATGSRYTKPNKEPSKGTRHHKPNIENIGKSTGSRHFNPNKGNLEQSIGTILCQPNNENIEKNEQFTNYKSSISQNKEFDNFTSKDIQEENKEITRIFQKEALNHINDEEEKENEIIAQFLIKVANISRKSYKKSDELFIKMFKKFPNFPGKEKAISSLENDEQLRKEFSSWVKHFEKDPDGNKYYENYFSSIKSEDKSLNEKYLYILFSQLTILYFHCKLSFPIVKVDFSYEPTFNHEKMIDFINKGKNRKVNFVILPSLFSNDNYLENGKSFVFTYKEDTYKFEIKDDNKLEVLKDRKKIRGNINSSSISNNSKELPANNPKERKIKNYKRPINKK